MSRHSCDTGTFYVVVVKKTYLRNLFNNATQYTTTAQLRHALQFFSYEEAKSHANVIKTMTPKGRVSVQKITIAEVTS